MAEGVAARSEPAVPAWGAWAAAGLAALIAGFVVAAPIDDVLGIASIVVTLAIVWVLAWRAPAVRAPLMVAFGVRAFAALVHAYVFPLPGAGLDAVGFENYGYEWSRGSWNSLVGSFRTGALLYSWIIALLYWLTDRSPLMIQTVNVFLGTLVVYNVFLITRLLWGEVPARRAAWVAALFPTLILFSAITLRELMVGYPLTLGALWLARWRLTDRMGWLSAAMAAFVAAIAFHTVLVGAFAYAMYAVVARTFGSLLRGELGRSAKALVGVTVVVGLMAGVLLMGIGASNPLWWFSVLTDLDPVRGYQGGGQVDRTDYLRWMVMSTPVDLVWQLPIRLVFFLFMPFPWLVRAVVDLVGLLDGLMYVWLVWHAFRVMRPVWRAPAASGIFGVMMSVTLVFALVVSNYGTAIRHRGKVAPLLIALAAGSLTRRQGTPGEDFLPTPR
ncbi:MAG TPA: hypothetical protein VE913_12835 [Longimicrobium sp.]|nr:hypothetical protein [Longimicrobium sp.]